jgi:tRNA (guanosine-2'-O-)-methyltransferase
MSTDQSHSDSADDNAPSDAWALLSPQLTENRRARMLATAAHRTNYVRLIVQDVHQPHNVSACIRSAEAFGVQNVDVVTLKGSFNTSTVARGVDEWVNIHRHQSVDHCIGELHGQGYTVAAAFPHGDSVSLDNLPLDKPIAVAFGNEHAGLDNEWREKADLCFTIPMFGIVESLNISVSAAITLHHLTSQLRKNKAASDYYLSPSQQQTLLNQWICRQIKTWPLQLKRLRNEAFNPKPLLK